MLGAAPPTKLYPQHHRKIILKLVPHGSPHPSHLCAMKRGSQEPLWYAEGSPRSADHRYLGQSVAPASSLPGFSLTGERHRLPQASTLLHSLLTLLED